MLAARRVSCTGCPALGSLAWTGSYFPHCPPPDAAAQVVGRYLVEIWKAVGMNMDRVEFLSASGEAAAAVVCCCIILADGHLHGAFQLPDPCRPIACSPNEAVDMC